MIRTKFLTAVAACSALLMAGCASTPKDLAEIDYAQKKSRAWNIASLFGPFPTDMDKELPGKSSVGDYIAEFFSTDTINFYDTFRNDFGWSKSSSFGMDMGLNLMSAFGPKPVPETNVNFGYLPADKTVDAIEARKVFNAQFLTAFEKAVKKTYPNVKVRTFQLVLPKGAFFEETLAGGVQIEDEAMGCKFLEPDTKDWSGLCEVGVWTRTPEAPVMSAKRLGPSVSAYYFFHNKLFLTGDKHKIDWVKILVESVDELPELGYIYLTQQENFEEREYPPMVLEKGKVNFFVIPKNK